MPSTYSSGLGLEKIANGEQASSWGTTTNENLDFIDDALYGNATVTLSGVTYTLDMQDGTTCSARNAYITFVGSPGGEVAVSLTPNSYQRVFTVKNGTAYTLTFSQGSGASLAVPSGASALVVADGAGAGAAVTGGSIFPLLEVATFKTTTLSPAIDGVGRIYRTTDGMRYDGLAHYFDAGSGTTRVPGIVVNSDGTVRIGHLHASATQALSVNYYGTGNRYAWVDLIGADGGAIGTRLLRGNLGANSDSALQHWGTGALYISAMDAGAVSIQTANTDRVRVTPAGAVGIGTTSPSHFAHINGDLRVKDSVFDTPNNSLVLGYYRGSAGHAYIDLFGTSGTTPGLRIIRGATGANADSGIQHWGTGALILETIDSAPILLKVDESEKARISTGGNLLVGTMVDDAANKVQVNGSVKTTGLILGSNSITYASSIPTGLGTQGDIAFNTGVTAGGTLGWVCTGGTTWKIFGIVAA
jgi:hypothetical protein